MSCEQLSPPQYFHHSPLTRLAVTSTCKPGEAWIVCQSTSHRVQIPGLASTGFGDLSIQWSCHRATSTKNPYLSFPFISSPRWQPLVMFQIAIKTSWSGASNLRSPFAQGSQILPNEFSPTFPHTSLSPNSGPYFSTPRVHNSQSSTSRTELPRLDMKYLQSTHGQLPITPDSPLHPSNFGNSTAHGQDQIVHGYLSQSTPGSYGTVLVEGNDNRKREFASDLSGMLPTPVTPNTQSGR
ncbi:hypothetical protein DFJ58DRAFT_330820 [Suillus subalutaceus]|uniref:uncharacterized protein n=1 Tax=Suillus subalutaceus TaxID=48586 RepID=UPI001B867735|nr:uncharacterized protein DFJ58DRAFT_330820 [Suillus subalutaceus]KAG1857386.1 hypothetical protein DFJ58DRAFT_330820 [Suillus subalutaceus]